MPSVPKADGDRRVLLLTPTRRDAEVTCALLGAAAIECFACSDAVQLGTELGRGAGAMVLTEGALGDPRIQAVLAQLELQPAWSDVPALVLSRDRDRTPAALRVLAQMSNVTLLDFPCSTRAMVSAVQSALRARRRQYQIRDQLVEQRRAEEALLDADRRKDEFLAMLAHELRNPLAVVRSGLQVLGLQPDDVSSSARVLAMMERQSRLLVKLIDELLDVSRIATGKLVLADERVDLRSIVEAAIETGHNLAEPPTHHFRLRLPSAPLWVRGDALRLAQVVGNLVSNSTKYTPERGTITLTLERSDDTATLCVADTGMGIPADMLPRVFDMFTQVNRTLDRAQGGLGIGLSLVQRLIALHGGTVAAESAGIDRGSAFTLRLPALPADAAAAPATPAPPTERTTDMNAPTLPPAAMATAAKGAAAEADPSEATHATAATTSAPAGPPIDSTPAHVAGATDAPRRRRVLVIDDNPDVVDILAALLEELGHQARVEYGGMAGVEAALEDRPDIILCDVGMPVMDGHEVASRLRADPRMAGTVLIALTGWGGEEDKRKARAAGFDWHLTKPVGADDLERVLATV
jgi:two-component system, sensor histidine kinase